MADKMLIDATHPEETRVVVLRGNRVEEFDFESANRKQLRGNIYLAKVTRVEPSLQAAFVEYGGNRHGFLAFSEIHPDYYQIPVADREALLAEEARQQREADDEADNNRGRHRRHRRRGATRRRDVKRSEPVAGEEGAHEEAPSEAVENSAAEASAGEPTPVEITESAAELQRPEPAEPGVISAQAADATTEIPTGEDVLNAEPAPVAPEQKAAEEQAAGAAEAAAEEDHAAEERAVETASAAGAPLETGEALATEYADEEADEEEEEEEEARRAEAAAEEAGENGNGEEGNGEDGGDTEEESVESVGGADALEEVQERMPRFRRQYKIQEVIKRRQVMLVQVVKEERGTKGAALTTYLSLAGRYSVLMPNTARGGGISRKITSAEDRGRLKEIAQELEVPEGMGVILRTAGASRTKAEVKRDFEYLLRLWEQVRDLTLKSMAPTLVYEEGSLVKRSIRDLYSKDIDEIVVAGEEGYKDARDFMRMLMPSHVKNVKQYKDSQPLFTRYGIESQLDAMFSPVVQLRSGGYIVLNQTEALVAIDVNSGRATREHHIEDTATKTNVEAAEEVARQLRLRDLAGLIVIDFIDMDEGRNNRTVERKLKEALKYDRARIQVGRISHFGLLEMSRQRIRASVLESSTEKCPVCGGSGHVRSVSSVALQALRAVEETLIKGATHNLIVRTRSEVALYMLNHKRAHLRELEERFRVTLTVSADPTVTGQLSYVIDRGEQMHTLEAARSLAQAVQSLAPVAEEEPEGEFAAEEAEAEVEAEAATGTGETQEGEREDGRRRRRRRGRGRGRNGEPREAGSTQETVAEHAIAHEDHDAGSPEEDVATREPGGEAAASADENGVDQDGRRRRRRGRRGGRRNRRDRNGEPLPAGSQGEFESDLQHAVEDLDRPPATEESWNEAPAAEPAYAPQFEQPFAQPVEQAVAPPLEQPMMPSTAEAEYPAPVGHDAPEAIEAEAEARAAEQAEQHEPRRAGARPSASARRSRSKAPSHRPPRPCRRRPR